MALLDVEGIRVRFGGVTALDGLSFSIDSGQVCALIGPNGAGKTTLFNVISRLYEPTEGTVTFDGQDLLALPPHQIAEFGIARTFQNLALVQGLSVLDNVMVGAHARTTGGFIGGLFGLPVRRRERQLRDEAMEVADTPGARARRARRRPPAFPTARSSASSSPGRWPHGPSCSCSTSPPAV